MNSHLSANRLASRLRKPGTATQQWIRLLQLVTLGGQPCSPRGMEITEILSNQMVIGMQKPIVSLVQRKMNYAYMLAESAWTIEGSNSVSKIAKYLPSIAKYSDNGITFNGSYGPMFIDQLNYVVECLGSDRDSRQAVVTIWRPKPARSKDIPCTAMLQWFIREGRLHCIHSLRSSDSWLGLPYDIFVTTMMTYYLGMVITESSGFDIELGNLYMNMGSSHIYSKDREAVDELLSNPTKDLFDYDDISLRQIYHPSRDGFSARDFSNTLYTFADGIRLDKAHTLPDSYNPLDRLKFFSSLEYKGY